MVTCHRQHADSVRFKHKADVLIIDSAFPRDGADFTESGTVIHFLLSILSDKMVSVMLNLLSLTQLVLIWLQLTIPACR